MNEKPWHITARPVISLADRLRILVGVPLFVRFTSPDGDCHAACNLSVVVQRGWPENTHAMLGGWPPLVRPLPPPPKAPLPPDYSGGPGAF